MHRRRAKHRARGRIGVVCHGKGVRYGTGQRSVLRAAAEKAKFTGFPILVGFAFAADPRSILTRYPGDRFSPEAWLWLGPRFLPLSLEAQRISVHDLSTE